MVVEFSQFGAQIVEFLREFPDAVAVAQRFGEQQHRLQRFGHAFVVGDFLFEIGNLSIGVYVILLLIVRCNLNKSKPYESNCNP